MLQGIMQSGGAAARCYLPEAVLIIIGARLFSVAESVWGEAGSGDDVAGKVETLGGVGRRRDLIGDAINREGAGRFWGDGGILEALCNRSEGVGAHHGEGRAAEGKGNGDGCDANTERYKSGEQSGWTWGEGGEDKFAVALLLL